MENFNWTMPTKFVFGKGAEKQVGPWLAEHGYKKVLIVYGKGHVVKSGLLDDVIASIKDAGVAYAELGGVRPNPEVTTVREGVALAKTEQVDFILPVGGGSTIDSSKAISYGACYDGDVWDFFSKDPAAHKDVEKHIPLGVVLTIPAAGSEASNSCVVSNDELGLKSSTSGDFNRPVVAFMDPELTMSLPPYQTGAGITDMCAHIFERFFSCSGDVPVTDNIAIALLRSIRVEGLRLVRDPNDYEARANIMWLGTLAHCGLAGLGRDEDWASHGIEHELSALNPKVTHGAGLAVIMPAWMRYVCAENPRRFVRLGSEVFGMVPTGDDMLDAMTAIDLIQDFFLSLGMPRYLDDFGFVTADVDKMIPTLHVNRGDEFGSFKKLTVEDAKRIYLSAFKPAEA